MFLQFYNNRRTSHKTCKEFPSLSWIYFPNLFSYHLLSCLLFSGHHELLGLSFCQHRPSPHAQANLPSPECTFFLMPLPGCLACLSTGLLLTFMLPWESIFSVTPCHIRSRAPLPHDPQSN